MNQGTKKKILIAVIVVFAVILVCTVGYLIFKQLNIGNAEQTNKDIQASYAAGVTGAVQDATQNPTGATNTLPSLPDIDVNKTEPGELVENPVDFEGLMKMNPDVYSWIYIPDTNVNLPVAQSPDDDNYYLEHDVYKDYSFPGTIFSQSMNKKDYSDRVTVLYGHNMLDGSMFATLHNFGDEDFFNSHPYFYIYTQDRMLTYEIISAHEYDDRHIMNSYDFTKDDVFSEWIKSAKNPHYFYSNVREEVNPDLNSKLVILSTCLNANEGRFLVQGVLIKDEKTK